jgi:hypothetical protein
MYYYSVNTMKSSTKTGVTGARYHTHIANITPVGGKVLMFMLCIQLMECYIINSIESLALNLLYVNIRSVINDLCNLQLEKCS